jgi:Zn-dependent membrane protease YugP
VFFLNDKQQEVVAKALSTAMSEVEENRTKALKNAAALTYIAQEFINSR